MTKVRAAVVGVGYLGRFHAQKYNVIENSELVGVCDASADRAEEVAKELGVTAFTDYKALVGKVDAVTVAATTTAHYEIAKFFLENGIHVHVEKPMTSTVAEGEELCRLAEQNNLKLQVGHVERFNPALIAAQEKLERPMFIECHRLAPFKPRGADVSVILNLMIHDLDVVQSLVRSPVASVSAVGTPVITQTIDIANARIEFESGAVCNLTSSRVSLKAQRKFRVFQKNQYLSIDFGSGEVNLLTKTGDWSGEMEELPIDSDAWDLEKGDAILAETQSFVDAIAKDQPVIVSGQDGLNALKLAEKITDLIYERLS